MSSLIAPKDLPRYVPGEVLAQSDGLGWRGLYMRAYDYHGQDVEIPAMRDYLLVSYQTGVTPMRRRFSGRWSETLCRPGAVSLLTRSQLSHWHWTEDVKVTHVYLTQDFVSKIAREFTGRGVEEVSLNDVLRTDDPVLTGAVGTIASEALSPTHGSDLYIEAVGRQLVIHLLRNYADIRLTSDTGRGQLSAAQRNRALEFIEANLHRHLELGEIAVELNLSISTFSRHFADSIGQPPYAYVTERRLERARRLLAETQRPAKEIAVVCGFSDQPHLTRMFSRRYGVTPAAFRKWGPGGTVQLDA
ncbi:helix-turn-helix transcriptional regulator [Denitrobaculum tricleocarpae]|uniref:Helix-turn-helix transcriptional regulator n=2 Tax=Denitrobaculum tricleocarpae TaxID=2591009 RepID=A0A545TL02_9PROT|nr:helix-turn-helix transcriptional regulator [Denitrobaculum tricleocarpae]